MSVIEADANFPKIAKPSTEKVQRRTAAREPRPVRTCRRDSRGPATYAEPVIEKGGVRPEARVGGWISRSTENLKAGKIHDLRSNRVVAIDLQEIFLVIFDSKSETYEACPPATWIARDQSDFWSGEDNDQHWRYFTLGAFPTIEEAEAELERIRVRRNSGEVNVRPN